MRRSRDLFHVPLPVKREGVRSAGEETLALHCRALGLGEPVREYLFAGSIKRRWRFDFAWVGEKVAVEVEGLAMRRIGGRMLSTGRHSSITGFEGDCEKYNQAVLMGWRVLRFSPGQVKRGEAVEVVRQVLLRARLDE